MPRRVALFVLLVLTTLSITPFASQGSAQPTDRVNYDWRQFGKQAVANADYMTKKRIESSPEERMRFVANEVGRQLNALKIMPNTNIIERGASWARYGDQGLGTCGHVTDSLKDALVGAGFDASRLVRVEVQKPTLRRRGPFDVNPNHMALAYLGSDGRIPSFDLWAHGGEHGTFGSFDESVFNGQDAAAWSEVMDKYGFTRQGCQDCADKTFRTAYLLLDTLRAQIDLLAEAEKEVPSGVVRFLVKNGTTSELLQGARIVVDGVSNSPSENFRASGTTDAAGSVDIRGIARGVYTVTSSHALCPPYTSAVTNLEPGETRYMRLACQKSTVPDIGVDLNVPDTAEVDVPVTASASISGWRGESRFQWFLPGSMACPNGPTCSLSFPWAGTFDIVVTAHAMSDGKSVTSKSATRTVTVRERRPRETPGNPPPSRPGGGAAGGGSSEEQLVAEYRSLLPAVLEAEKKPWHTRFNMIANALKQGSGYRVNYQTFCLIEQGPDKGKDYACFEFDTVLDAGALKSAVADMKRRLGR